MAESPIIRVANLGKRYRLAHEARHDTLRDSLAHGVRGLLKKWLGRRAASTAEEFWALRDVSFDVQRGEVVGVIGRNGAGKSTLLKILSRITEPSVGRVELRGRVASLLEVGTGFHPELTGRENIFLNGAILGMSRTEILRKFDEIVAFAEVERFLDTPVKHYSSGMYVRLAFAVAAHLEPEILIIDEVLAVGDLQFQKKCLGKMQEVARGEGRTVLFVSHNTAAVLSLCTKGLLLQHGQLAFAGDTADTVKRYLQPSETRTSSLNLRHRTTRAELAVIRGGQLVGAHAAAHEFQHGEPIAVELDLEVERPVRFCAEFIVRDQQGVAVAFHSPGLSQGAEVAAAAGRHRLRAELVMPPLAAGDYVMDVGLAQPGIRYLDFLEAGFAFSVAPTSIGPRNWNFEQRRGQGCVLLAGTQSLAPADSPG